MKTVIKFLICFFVTQFTFAQQFSKIYRNSAGDDIAYNVINDNEENALYVCGETTTGTLKLAFVMKLDGSTGAQIWNKTYSDGPNSTFFRDIVSDGTYLYAAGSSYANSGNYKGFVVKINPSDGTTVLNALLPVTSSFTFLLHISIQKNLLFVSGNSNLSSGYRGSYAALDFNLNLVKNYEFSNLNTSNITTSGYPLYIGSKRFTAINPAMALGNHDPALIVSDTVTFGAVTPIISLEKHYPLSSLSDGFYKIDRKNNVSNNVIAIGHQRAVSATKLGAFFMELDFNNLNALNYKRYNFNTLLTNQNRQFRVDEFNRHTLQNSSNVFIIPITEIITPPYTEADMGYFIVDETGIITDQTLINSGIGKEDVSFGATIAGSTPVVVGYSKLYGDKDIFIAKTNGNPNPNEGTNCIYNKNFLVTTTGPLSPLLIFTSITNPYTKVLPVSSTLNFTYPSIPSCLCLPANLTALTSKIGDNDNNNLNIQVNYTNDEAINMILSANLLPEEYIAIYKQLPNNEIEHIKTLSAAETQGIVYIKDFINKNTNADYYYQILQPSTDLGIPNTSPVLFHAQNSSAINSSKTVKFNVFPSPANDKITLFFNNYNNVKDDENIFYSIINITGSVIKEGIVKLNHDKGGDIDIKSLPSGSFMISAILNGERFNQKIIINKE